MALAHELLSFQEGPSCAYYLALARTCLLKEDFSKCQECLREAVRIDPVVILSVFLGCSTVARSRTLAERLCFHCVGT